MIVYVGSFKLQVSFAEYSLFYRALLQKRPITRYVVYIHYAMIVCVQCIYIYEAKHIKKNTHIYVYISIHNAHKNKSCSSHMGWLRLVGSLKLYVSFAKEPIKENVFCKQDL